MKKKLILAVSIFALVLLVNIISASLNVSLADHGSNIRNKTSGNLLDSSNLTVLIYDNATGGNLIYNETFNNAIINGSWNVMLGENSSNPLPLQFGQVYYKDYIINGENINFTNLTGQNVDRQFFYSPLGDINYSYISNSPWLLISNWNATNSSYALLNQLNNGTYTTWANLFNGSVAWYQFTNNNFNGTGYFNTSGQVNGSTIYASGLNLTIPYLLATNNTFTLLSVLNNGTYTGASLAILNNGSYINTIGYNNTFAQLTTLNNGTYSNVLAQTLATNNTFAQLSGAAFSSGVNATTFNSTTGNVVLTLGQKVCWGNCSQWMLANTTGVFIQG